MEKKETKKGRRSTRLCSDRTSSEAGLCREARKGKERLLKWAFIRLRWQSRSDKAHVLEKEN